MLLAACEQFLSKSEELIQQVALETLEGHQRAIMGSMTVEVSKATPAYSIRPLPFYFRHVLTKIRPGAIDNVAFLATALKHGDL